MASALWRHREFLKFWAGSGISDVGSQVTALALPLIAALTLHATPWQMGLLAASGSAPVLVVGLFAGVWVDRIRRRPVMIATDVGRALLLSIIPLAAVTGVLRMEILYAVMLLTGSLTVLFDVAHMSFVPSLVSATQLVDGNSKIKTTSAAAEVAGPSLGGVLVSVLGAPFAVLVDALSFLGSAIFIAWTRVNESLPRTRDERAGVVAEIGEGLRVVIHDRIRRALAGCSATIILFGRMFNAVYVLYLTRHLGLSAVGVGLVFGTGGVGSLLGSIVAAPIARRYGTGRTMIGAQLAFGLTGLMVPLAVFVPEIALPMIVASEFAQWMALLIYYVNGISLRQAITPDRLQGRVNATMRFLAGGATLIGALIGGALGGVIGVPLTLVVACGGMLLSFLWLLLSPVREVQAVPTVAREVPA
ncbi:MAG TPA: MFS transporter [Verrucomicrobiae bacterium]|jgi:MFS family permease|nr:MFS transporter [Verrucomicrobiae bacterium]